MSNSSRKKMKQFICNVPQNLFYIESTLLCLDSDL